MIRERNLEDATLASAAARGDQQAFDLLVERYRGYIYAIAYRVTLHEDDALDVSQNVLLRLVQRIGDYRGTGTFKGWLGAVAANEAVSFARERARRNAPRIDYEPEAIEQVPTTGPDSRLLASVRERRAAVDVAMRRLSPQQRAVFALQFESDLKPAEVARQLGIPPGQVRSQMVRALAKIRSALFGRAETEETKHG
jgi:RNA polymerase sigma-70 factor, ECF subfamily